MIRLPPQDGPLITLSFKLHKGVAAAIISWREGGSEVMPFAPCHVEAIKKNGRRIGMFGDSHDGNPPGMMELAANYDDGQLQVLPDGRLCEVVVDLPVRQSQADAFYAGCDAEIGKPYDWMGIGNFAPIRLPMHMHWRFHAFCSSEMINRLRVKDCEYFRYPLCLPQHDIDPAMLLLILSAMVEVPH